jgi:hypothetical protein
VAGLVRRTERVKGEGEVVALEARGGCLGLLLHMQFAKITEKQFSKVDSCQISMQSDS